MEKLTKAIQAIKQPDPDVHKAALERHAQQARPSGSLGLYEQTSARLASISGKLNTQLKRKIVVACAGDHGVVAEGVSLFPQEVTQQMVYNFINGGAAVSVLAVHANATVEVADLGVNHDFEPELPIFHKKVRKATSNFAREPAMTKAEAVQSMEAGIEIVEELLKEGPVDILGTGDMGIGNTTPSTAIIAAFSGIDVSKLTGRGTGINDEMLENKIKVIEQALKLHSPDPEDALDVLTKVGGFEIGGLAGLVIGAAAYNIPVVCDGLISTAGALIACELCPTAKAYLFASHLSAEVGHAYMHQHLKLQPMFDLQFRLGEGTGAVVAMEMLDAATRILADVKTWDEANIKNVQE